MKLNLAAGFATKKKIVCGISGVELGKIELCWKPENTGNLSSGFSSLQDKK
jgi:hypothetical protein